MDKNNSPNAQGAPEPQNPVSINAEGGVNPTMKGAVSPENQTATQKKEVEIPKAGDSGSGGETGVKTRVSDENNKHSHRMALDEEPPDIYGFSFPFQPPESPHQPLLVLDPTELETWVKILKETRCLVLRCLDSSVLFAIEVAISQAKDFAGIGALIARFPAGAISTQGKLESRDDSFSLTMDALCSGSVNSELLMIVRAYDSPYATPFLGFLPVNQATMSDLQGKLGKCKRYVLVLTTPDLLEVNVNRRNMPAFQSPADFLFPHLKDSTLRKALEDQYKAGWWTEQASTDYRLDKDFYSVIGQYRDRLPDLVRAGLEISNYPKKNDRDAFQKRLQQKVDPDRLPGKGWPQPDDYLGMVLLFTASFFQDLALATYEQVVSQLLGDESARQPVPSRLLRSKDKDTQIQVFRDVPWQRVWKDARDIKIANSLSLRVAERNGTRVVVPSFASDPRGTLKAFAEKFPFIWSEMWERVLGLGLLFDPDGDISEEVRKRVLERVEAEKTYFGKAFLSKILFSNMALGNLRGTVEERFELLEKRGELNFVISRLSGLLSSMLGRDREVTQLAISAIEQLIDAEAPGIALRLLRILAQNPNFELFERLALVARILNQSGKEYWKDACRLLQRWASNAIDAAAIIQKISGWLPSEETLKQPGSVTPAALVLIGLASDWLQGPPPVKRRHELPDILAASPDGKLLSPLVRWLFHPALERWLEDPKWYFSYWLLADLTRGASPEEKQMLSATQVLLIDDYENALIPSLESGLQPILPESVPIAREFQATVIADWAVALQRMNSGTGTDPIVDLTNALALHVPDAARRQIYAIWRAMDLATTKYTPLPGTPVKLVREIREKFSEGRKVWKLLVERWPGQKKSAGAA